MRRRLLPLLVLVALAAAGCGQQTGLQIENGGRTVKTVSDTNPPPTSTTSTSQPGKGVMLGQNTALAYDEGTVWAAVWGGGPSVLGSLVQIDATTGQVVGEPTELPPSASPYLLAVGAGSIWIADGMRIWRVDPHDGHLIGNTEVDGQPQGLLVTPNAVWVTVNNDVTGGSLVKLSTVDGAEVGSVSIGKSAGPLTAIPGTVWVADPVDGTLSRIDPTTLKLKGHPVPVRAQGADPVSQLTVYDKWVWVYEGRYVLRASPFGGPPNQKVTLPPGQPGDMGAGSGGIWISNGNQLLQIDAGSGTIAGTHTVPGALFTTVITGNGSVWALDSRHGRLVRIKVD